MQLHPFVHNYALPIFEHTRWQLFWGFFPFSSLSLFFFFFFSWLTPIWWPVCGSIFHTMAFLSVTYVIQDWWKNKELACLPKYNNRLCCASLTFSHLFQFLNAYSFLFFWYFVIKTVDILLKNNHSYEDCPKTINFPRLKIYNSHLCIFAACACDFHLDTMPMNFLPPGGNAASMHKWELYVFKRVVSMGLLDNFDNRVIIFEE